MSGEMKWFRLYSEIIRDPKVRRLKDAAKFGILVGLLALAGESKIRGWVCIEEDMPYELGELAEILMATPEKITETISDLQKLRIIQVDDDGIIKFPNWDKRQYDKSSDRPEAVRERVKRHREKKKSVSPVECNANVTPLKRVCNAIDTDTDTDTDTDIYKHDDDDNARAREAELEEAQRQIVSTYNQTMGRLISKDEADYLLAFVKDGMDVEVVCESLRRTRLQGKTNVKYALSILRNWADQGVINMAGVERVDAEYEQLKQQKVNNPPIRNPDNRMPRGFAGLYELSKEANNHGP